MALKTDAAKPANLSNYPPFRDDTTHSDFEKDDTYLATKI